MKKSILFGVSVAAVAAILLGALALGLAGAPADVKNNEDSIDTSTGAATRDKALDDAIAGAQANVSFNILRPSYIPPGYVPDTGAIAGTKFIGTSTELEQAELAYTKGNDTLSLHEVMIIKSEPNRNNATPPEDTRRKVDINGVEGRFSVEPNGEKYLSWKISNLSLTIRSYTFNGSAFSGTSLSMDDMIKMAGSVR